MEIHGLTVSVGYDDLAAVTLPRNLRHLASVTMLTSPDDVKTQALCRQYDRVRCVVTDAFTRHGAKFNKGLAIEEASRELAGWVLIFDADIILPDSFALSKLNADCLYGAKRRILDDPSEYRDGIPWIRYPTCRDRDVYGYFQLFNTSSKFLTKRPWYEPTFTHAGGCDAYFASLFPRTHKRWLAHSVLHLGPRDKNWFGRVTPRMDGEPVAKTKDEMEALLRSKGWSRPKTGEVISERVDVPGYDPTGFELK